MTHSERDLAQARRYTDDDYQEMRRNLYPPATARERSATGHRDRSDVTDPGRPHEPSSNETNP